MGAVSQGDSPVWLTSKANREVCNDSPNGGGCQGEGNALQEGWEAETEGIKEQHVLLLPEHWQVCHLHA